MWMSLSGTFSPVILMALKQLKNIRYSIVCFYPLGLLYYITASPDLRASSHICTRCQKPAREHVIFEQTRKKFTKVAFPGISGGAPPAPYLLKIVRTNKPPELS